MVIIGYIVVVGSVFGGGLPAGGHVASLLQPVEIHDRGRRQAPFVVGNSSKAIKATLKVLPSVFKGPKYTKALYL